MIDLDQYKGAYAWCDKIIKECEELRQANERLVEALKESTDVLIKCIQEAGNRGTQRAVIPMIQKWKALAANPAPRNVVGSKE